MSNSRKKLMDILSCPTCHLDFSSDNKTCKSCERSYPEHDGIIAPINDLTIQEQLKTVCIKEKTLKEKIKDFIPMPDERLWSQSSKKIIKKILLENDPQASNCYVVNMGSGVESFYKKVFSKYDSLIRIGIPHKGSVDVFGDAMQLPLKSNSVDLFFSSSVIEHLPDPERAVSELFRTIKPGGLVYAEIPFIGAYHMAPNDYQRYTISGIESLFNRHGFEMVEKGICSGPINALLLLAQHAVVEAIPIGPIQYIFRLILTWLLHPFKYLDYIFNRFKWGEYLACNFYYLGRKPL